MTVTRRKLIFFMFMDLGGRKNYYLPPYLLGFHSDFTLDSLAVFFHWYIILGQLPYYMRFVAKSKSVIKLPVGNCATVVVFLSFL